MYVGPIVKFRPLKGKVSLHGQRFFIQGDRFCVVVIELIAQVIGKQKNHIARLLRIAEIEGKHSIYEVEQEGMVDI